MLFDHKNHEYIYIYTQLQNGVQSCIEYLQADALQYI